MKTIAIFGGGIAGLTVAHECVQNGFAVHVYEQKAYCGGKAFGRKNEEGLHVEHSIRTYGAGYHHLFQTLRQIPDGPNRTVFDNLVGLPGVHLVSGQDPRRNRLLPSLYTTPKVQKLLALLRILRSWQVKPSEVIRFIRLAMDYSLKSDRRQIHAYQGKSFAQYAKLDTLSPPFREFITSFLDIIVAAKPYASANVLLQLINRIFFPDKVVGLTSTLNVMNGPTNDRFIDPWVRHLQQLGVQFHLGHRLDNVVLEAGAVKEVLVDKTTHVNTDAYVLALPFQHVSRLVPSLSLPDKPHREWSFSYQFYLREIPSDWLQYQTFTLVLDSPWKLVYLVEAAPIWQQVALRPDVQGILSVTLSNVYTPGRLTGKALHQCSPEEVQAELLHQLNFQYSDLILDACLDNTVAYLPEEVYQQRRDELVGWSTLPPNEYGCRWLTESTLFIAEPTDEPGVSVATNLPNLFLAGEFIQTSYRIPTMEQANESGKLCAARICQQFGIPYDLTRFKRPEPPFRRIRQLDALLMRILH